MPIYEYRCGACEHELEKLQRMNDDKLVDCPACSQPALKRLVSAAAFRLKGSGWYETDFKQGNKRNLAESANQDSLAKSATGKDKSAKTDSVGKDKSATAGTEKKPAVKATAKPAKTVNTSNA